MLGDGKGAGGFGAGAITYMHQLMSERMTGELVEPFQGNAYTCRDHEREGVARSLNVNASGRFNPQEVGIILNHDVSYSPDSLVGANCFLEIKTKRPKFQIEVLLSGKSQWSTSCSARAVYGSASGNGSTLSATGLACRSSSSEPIATTS